jgi:uncharacterized protein YecE (DUF72 family)
MDESSPNQADAFNGDAALFLGTSSWSAPSWEGPFYPKGTPASEYLRVYAERFNTVEIDATWYRSPSARTVDGWNAKTPAGEDAGGLRSRG